LVFSCSFLIQTRRVANGGITAISAKLIYERVDSKQAG
jgi:hypothetical protein